VEKTEDLENLIREKAAKLDKLSQTLDHCRVTVERPHKHQTSGSGYEVTIIMSQPPGRELVVRREAGEGSMHDPLSSVLREAFQVAWRKLRDQVDMQRGETKRHPEQEISAVVDRLLEEEDCGFLRTIDGREVYFHRNSVLDGDYDRLSVGTGVRHVEEVGRDGPQASTVQIVDKPGVRAGRR
jgi:cold shock CspA family protein